MCRILYTIFTFFITNGIAAKCSDAAIPGAFRIGGYVVLMGIYVIIGFILLMVSEKIYQKRGN